MITFRQAKACLNIPFHSRRRLTPTGISATSVIGSSANPLCVVHNYLLILSQSLPKKCILVKYARDQRHTFSLYKAGFVLKFPMFQLLWTDFRLLLLKHFL